MKEHFLIIHQKLLRSFEKTVSLILFILLLSISLLEEILCFHVILAITIKNMVMTAFLGVEPIILLLRFPIASLKIVCFFSILKVFFILEIMTFSFEASILELIREISPRSFN
jgi:hypothetical protein